jgi:guanyl-specific ribonuclease Sa
MSLQKKANIIYGFFFLILTGFILYYFLTQNKTISVKPTEINTFEIPEKSDILSRGVPVYVIEVLTYVKKYNEPKKGYIGGRKFFNREKRLPERENSGKKIEYKEWDVHPGKINKNRGPERLVTGSNNKAYYTHNHYRDFTEIK